MPVPALNNLAYFSTTGPQLIYWCPRNSDAFTKAMNQDYSGMAYLGTTVRSPKINTANAHEKVMNSLVGTMIPAEKSFQGVACSIVCPMNRVSESSLRRLKALPFSYGTGSTGAVPDAGKYQFQDLGSLSNQDGAALLVVFLNALAPSAGVPSLPLGIRFFCATLEESDQDELTTVPKVDTLTFEANVARNQLYAFNASFGGWDQQYGVYDFEVLNHSSFVAPS